MLSKYRLSHKPFELKSIKKSKYFELYKYIIPVKNIKTGEITSFLIELFSINPAFSTKQLRFSAQNLSISKSNKASFILVRVGLLTNNKKIKHVFFPSDEIRYNKKHKSIELGNYIFSPDQIIGVLGSNNDGIEWKIIKKDQTNLEYFLSHKVFIKKNNPYKFKCFNASAFPSFSGQLRLGDEKYEVINNNQISFFDRSWGTSFSKPLCVLASKNFISLISGKKIDLSHFIFQSTYNYKTQNHLNYLALHCNGQLFRFIPKQLKILISEKKELRQWAITAENKKYLMDIDIFCPQDTIMQLAYSFESTQRAHAHDQYILGTSGYGELRIYKKNKKKLETIEHVRIENCFFEQSLNLPSN